MAKGSPIKKALSSPAIESKDSPSKSIFRRLVSKTWLPLLLAVATFSVYWPTLKSEFVYDARVEILEEGFITSISNLPAVLSLKVLSMSLMLGTRPGQLLYMMLNAAIWGKEPFGYHLSSNLLHAVNVALLFVLLRRLVSTEITGLTRNGAWRVQLMLVVVTLIFAWHPIAVESVAEVSYSSSLLVTFFTLLGLLMATAFRPENLRVAWITGCVGAFCAFAAVASKETGIATAPLLIVYWFLFRRREAKVPWFLFLGSATVATAAFLAARFLLAPPVDHHFHYLGGSFSQVFLVQPRLWVFMMGKLFWPVPLSADYTPEDENGLPLVIAFILLGMVVSLQLWLAYKSGIGALGVAVYWLGLATVSNFVPLYCPVADRFYYLPLAGFALQLLAVLLMTVKSRWGFFGAWPLCLIALLPLVLLTLTRQKVFADDLSLWSDTARASPSSSLAYSGIGYNLSQKGLLDEAIVQYSKALEINPNFAETYSNLGNVLFKKGQVDEAITLYRKCLEIHPNFDEGHNNLGNALLKKGQVDEAMAEFRRAMEISPDFVMARCNLGLAFVQKGQDDEAIAQFQKILETNPTHSLTHYNLGLALVRKGEIDEAIIQFQKAQEIDPNYTEAHNNLGALFLQKERTDEAIAQFQKVLAITPNSAEGHSNLGAAFLQKDRVDEAIAQFKKALNIDPNLPAARNNLDIALSKKAGK